MTEFVKKINNRLQRLITGWLDLLLCSVVPYRFDVNPPLFSPEEEEEVEEEEEEEEEEVEEEEEERRTTGAALSSGLPAPQTTRLEPAVPHTAARRHMVLV